MGKKMTSRDILKLVLGGVSLLLIPAIQNRLDKEEEEERIRAAVDNRLMELANQKVKEDEDKES